MAVPVGVVDRRILAEGRVLRDARAHLLFRRDGEAREVGEGVRCHEGEVGDERERPEGSRVEQFDDVGAEPAGEQGVAAQVDAHGRGVPADGVEANSDLYASAEYRSHLARIYTRRAIEKALERALEQTDRH